MKENKLILWDKSILMRNKVTVVKYIVAIIRINEWMKFETLVTIVRYNVAIKGKSYCETLNHS